MNHACRGQVLVEAVLSCHGHWPDRVAPSVASTRTEGALLLQHLLLLLLKFLVDLGSLAGLIAVHLGLQASGVSQFPLALARLKWLAHIRA